MTKVLILPLVPKGGSNPLQRCDSSGFFLISGFFIFKISATLFNFSPILSILGQFYAVFQDFFTKFRIFPQNSTLLPLRKPLSHRNLQLNLHHICMGYKKITILQKNSKCCPVLKGRPKNRFLFHVILVLAKICKTTFPKEFFNEIWLKVGEYE